MTSRKRQTPSLRTKAGALALLLCGATSLLLAGCGGPPGGFQQPPPIVVLSPVALQSWQVTYTTTGTVEANNVVDLNVETPGLISSLTFHEGQYVKRGTTLMRLKADKFNAQVNESTASIQASQQTVSLQNAQIDQLQAMVDAAEARQKNAADEYQRFQSLKQQEFISELELNQKRTQFDTTTADLSAARQQLLGARASKQQAIANLSRAKSTLGYSRAVAGETVITAPFSGTVGKKYVALGDYVAPTEKLLTLVDNSVMKIAFPVPERYIGSLRTGLQVRLDFEGVTHDYLAQVNFIDPVVDMESRNVMVKAVIQNPDSAIRHGQFGNVHLVLGTISKAVVIPEEAIVNQGEKRLVYVVKDDVAHQREITVQHREAGRVHVSAGLKAGEQIVIGGLQKVADGQKVNVATPGDKPKVAAPEKADVKTPAEKE